jgi:hypothetical protein
MKLARLLSILLFVFPSACSSLSHRKRSSLPDVSVSFQKREKEEQFEAAVLVASANILLNTLRPDPDISLQMRFPRVLWELSIAIVAKSAASIKTPPYYILLCIMLISTSLVDIFVWAPLFAFTANFETCSGWLKKTTCYTDYVKGIGRLIVVAQCLMGGLVYLLTGITAWDSYVTHRDRQLVDREVLTMREKQRAIESLS